MTTLTLSLPLGRFGTGFGKAVSATLAHWRHLRMLARTRRIVADMDEHMVADIGVSRAQITFELDRARRRRPLD